MPALTSTDIRPLNQRLPPLSGLLDDTLDQAIRARQRRIMIAGNPHGNLAALRVTDSAIDRALKSASLYGKDAALQLDARIAKLDGAAQEAAVFLRISLAVQTQEPALLALTSEYTPKFTRAIRDAYWFYPAPFGPFNDSSDHIVALFNQSAANTELRLLALELAGRRDVKALRPQIEALLDNPSLAPAAHYALACMGAAGEPTRRFLKNVIESNNAALFQSAMAIVAVDSRLLDEATLNRLLNADSDKADDDALGAAWAIQTCRHPRKALDYASTHQELSSALRLRIAALAGYMDGIIIACAAMAASDGSITPLQADVLEVALGGVPVEARCEPNDQAAKSKALRDLILRVCRKSHIPICNEADLGPWEVEAILSKPEQPGEIRLRNGLPLRDSVPALGRAVFEVTHAMREWLYIERATTGQHAFALSALDVTRRQELALMVGELVDDMRTD